MRTRKTVAGYLLATLAAGAVSFVVAYKARSQSEPLDFSRRPFIAQIVEKDFGVDGHLVSTVYSMFARKTNGSDVKVTAIKGPDGEVGQLKGVWDVDSLSEAALDPFTKSVRTLYFSRKQMWSTLNFDEPCPPNEVGTPHRATGARSQMLGFEVVQVVEEHTAPSAPTERWEAWVAPAFGCFALRESSSLSSGPHNETEVTLLVEAEPPDALFAIPSDYVERSPSAHAAAWTQKYPGSSLLPQSGLAWLDHVYDMHRKRY